MADIEFTITGGPYAGRYEIDKGDISAVDVGDLKSQQGGPNLDAFLTGQAPLGLEAFAALVWLVRRRGGNRGLAYRAVAEHINFDVIDTTEMSEESAEKLPDPSTSANDS